MWAGDVKEVYARVEERLIDAVERAVISASALFLT